MEENKVIVDRAKLSSEYIAERQDFNQVLKAHRAAKPSLWKSSWFYGPVGLAVIAVTVAAAKFNPSTSVENKSAYEAKITLEEPTRITSNTPVLAQTLPTPELESKPAQVVKETSKSMVRAQVALEKSELENPKDHDIAEETKIKSSVQEAPMQVEEASNEVLEPKIASNPGVPKIAGVFNGRVKADLICSSGVIEMNEGWYVLSYTIQYYNGIEDVIEKFNTDLIPPKLCSDLKRFNANSPVNITSIVAENLSGERKLVPSMQITPIY